ncbi:MAG: MBL fold metallo-hydrolase [Bdellovibrionaceae bacterium]|nr:MBL fold metallo-hydrolase [Pseudobdellovibrionaceae bacterium]
MSSNLFYQLFESETSTYTYLIADPVTKEAALIDTVAETMDRDLNLVKELGLKLKYVLDTHIHADHITAAGEIRKRTDAKTAVSEEAKVNCVDIPLKDGQELTLGDKKIIALATPGHTDSCMSFVFDGKVFTGDALLIRGTGRTDFQQGSSAKLYDSIQNKLYTLPETTEVYPGHDYRGQTKSTIGLEMHYNPRIEKGTSKEQFVKTMSELKLAHPKKIHEAVPANLSCGVAKQQHVLHPVKNDGVPEVSAANVQKVLGRVRLIDVRRPEEFNAELGHIEGAELVTLGEPLMRFLEHSDRDEEIVFVCRSGGRSGQATMQSLQMGYKHTANMVGGMLYWNELKYPIIK